MYLNNIDFTNKKIILRVDFNVPIKDNIITSDKRILAVLPTIEYIMNSKPSRLIIISHMGRPKGFDMKKTLLPVFTYLEKIFKNDISFSTLEDLDKNHNKIILLENIRFYEEETFKINDISQDKLDIIMNFRKRLSVLGDVFVNDAFGCCHRAHSSIVGIECKEKCMGLLIEKEMKYLKESMKLSGHKTLILGGSKVTDKIKLINNLIPKMDTIIIGGAMVFTFYRYLCFQVGKSLVDEEGVDLVEDILYNAEKHHTKIILPIDFVGSTEFSENGMIQTFDIKYGINENYMGLDIGPQSVKIINHHLKETDIIFWNGPLGVFEMKRFEKGSRDVMEFIAKNNIKCVVGGGDTASCCEKFELEKYMTHVSTGGGASLELLEGKVLPGIKFLEV